MRMRVDWGTGKGGEGADEGAISRRGRGRDGERRKKQVGGKWMLYMYEAGSDRLATALWDH